MKLRVFLVVLAGCLMLSACGAVVSETHTETPGATAADTVEATVTTEASHPDDFPAEPTAAQENRYHGWDYYNSYACAIDGKRKYWIEFSDEFYLHCMFRSGSPEYHEVVYTLYPDWDAPTAQELTIRTVMDADGNDITHQFERLAFAFSSEDHVLMQVRRDESTLTGGEEDNILTGNYTFLPQ